MKYLPQLFGLMMIAVLIMPGCKKDDDSEKQAAIDEQIILDYLAANNIDATRHESGLYYVITDEGTGDQPTIYNMVEVYYKGYFTDGSIFDQTTSGPVSLSLQSLIPGWQIGIPLIKEGGSIRLFLPSALGYGNSGSGSVPPNTVIFFDIDLVNIS